MFHERSDLQSQPLAGQSKLRTEHRRRLEIIQRTQQGQTQTEIQQAVGCARETVRYWSAMARAGQVNQYEQSVGRPRVVSVEYLDRLRELVDRGPKHYGYSFQQWTARWLRDHLLQEFGFQVSERHINRLLKQMGLSTRQRSKS
jgi:transposase